MDTVLICGGFLEEEVAKKVLEKIVPDCIIGIDKGLEFCYKNKVYPQYILGDFDSIDKKVLDFYENHCEIPVQRYKPEKDATDTRIGLELALKLGSSRIFMLGATGGRLDHYMGNLQSLQVALKQGAKAWIIDSQNVITVWDKSFSVKKEEIFGTYISFLAMSEKVEGITLKGFKYPLHEYTMTNDDGIGISNEIKEDIAHVEFKSGIILMIMSKDKNER